MSSPTSSYSYDWKIFKLRSSSFVLWTGTKIDYVPTLMLGKIVQEGGSQGGYRFEELLSKNLSQPDPARHESLWTLAVADISAEERAKLDSTNDVYHYWFEVTDTSPGSSGSRVKVTDPFATAVDYRLVQDPDGINQPASVIKINKEVQQLVPCDPSGAEVLEIKPSASSKTDAPKNNELVIYELPVSWTKASSDDRNARDIGTFRDVLALLKMDERGVNFADVALVARGAILADLGVNALELLPPTDSKVRDEWGYAPAHYFAPDYDLGGPKHNASTDFGALAQHCLNSNIRLINDTVMAFGYDSYKHINFSAFHVSTTSHRYSHDWEEAHNSEDDAWLKPEDRDKSGLRNSYGGSLWRYITTHLTWNVFNGNEATLACARAFHKAHLAWWMSKFHLGGFRLDSVNNVANWDFVREFRADAREHFRSWYGTSGDPDDYFLVIGEELDMPIDIVKGENRPLDAIWNEEFQRRLRCVIVGWSYGEDTGSAASNFKWTVRKLIDCTQMNLWTFDKHFDSGLQAINYITSHDTEGNKKERLYNYLKEWRLTDQEVLQRCKLAFVCLLTAVGIPMIFSGEEFCDEGDQQFVHPYKQRDPVNWERKNDPWRSELFQFVRILVELRKSSQALTNLDKNSVDFIWSDPTDGRVQSWIRKSASGEHMVAVIANFSDATYPNRYDINTWSTPANRKWSNVITHDQAPDAGHERLEPWDVKVYNLV